jgi:hypothetical protein
MGSLDMLMRARAVGCLVAFFVLSGVILPGLADARAQAVPTLETILARSGRYVLQLETDLSGIVAEEHYSQDILADRRQDEIHRSLKSDLLLVRPNGAERYIQFRDVFEVDGRPVRDRDDRLATLFLHPVPSSSEQLHEIATESARYNIGNVSRVDLNVPVLALIFLEPDNQPRSRFTVAKIGSAGQPWEIEYREVQPQTLIRTTGNRDLPARGRFRIDPTSGRVWMSELIAEDTGVHGDFTVEYRFEPALGFLVPEEMRESVWIPPRGRAGAETRGKATYSRFRRFQVTVDEAIAPPKE